MEHDVMGLTVKDGLPKDWPEWQHKFTDTKASGPKERIKVEAGLHYIQGNSSPYFSVTGTIYEGSRDVGGGCIHEEILKLWPELKPVVALHLSDMDGVPMHPEGNGWYWLAGAYGGAGERYHGGNSNPPRDPQECLRVFAEHVRITVEEAEKLAEEWQRGIPYSEAKPLFQAWSLAQRPRWKAEAVSAIAVLDALREGKK